VPVNTWRTSVVEVGERERRSIRLAALGSGSQ